VSDQKFAREILSISYPFTATEDVKSAMASFFLSALGSIHFYCNWRKVVTNWHVHLVTTFQSIQESLKELWLYAGSLGSAGCT
jgi:hypothetical protein